MSLSLEAGKIYSLKVNSFKKRGREFPKKDGKTYESFFVELEDKQGNTVKCEHIAVVGTCVDCFHIGVFQYIKCEYVSPNGSAEVVPSEDPEDFVNTGKGVSLPKEEIQFNQASVPIGGKSITFAMGFAKDILVAEIGHKPFGYEVTDSDISRLIKWADDISNAISERVNF